MLHGMTMGAFVSPSVETAPEAAVIGELKDIQDKVGGTIDAVRTEMGEGDNAFVLVGYVHDEGRILNLPVNFLASLIFGQELRGPVVLVSGTNPDNKEYDGENYDLPSEFFEFLRKNMYEDMRRAYFVSRFITICLESGVQSKAVSMNDAAHVLSEMQKASEESIAGTTDSLDVPARNTLSRAIAHLLSERCGFSVKYEPKEGE